MTVKKQMHYYSNYEFTLWGDNEPRPVYRLASQNSLLGALKELSDAGQDVFSIKTDSDSSTVVVK